MSETVREMLIRGYRHKITWRQAEANRLETIFQEGQIVRAHIDELDAELAEMKKFLDAHCEGWSVAEGVTEVPVPTHQIVSVEGIVEDLLTEAGIDVGAPSVESTERDVD